MKLITDIDKNNCYEVVDGQNHYLVPFDYGCYAYKDIQRSEEERIRGISDWKQFCAELGVVKMISPIPWLKFTGTRGKTIKDSILKLSSAAMNLYHPFCVQTRSGEYLVVSTAMNITGHKPSSHALYVGEYQGFRYRVECYSTNYHLEGSNIDFAVVWHCVKEPVLKPISITHKD